MDNFLVDFFFPFLAERERRGSVKQHHDASEERSTSQVRTNNMPSLTTSSRRVSRDVVDGRSPSSRYHLRFSSKS